MTFLACFFTLSDKKFNLVVLLIYLADSVGMKLVSALIRVAKTVQVELDHTQVISCII